MMKLFRDGIHSFEEIAPNTWRIDEGGIANCYLLCGSERALLIDTGCGLGDLCALAGSLTALPLDAVLTHRHCDHAGGAGFYARCYVHRADLAPVYGLLSSRLAVHVLLGKNTPKGFTRAPHRPNWVGIEDGHTFALGGRTVTAVQVPGHTRGSIVLIDDAYQCMFTGDDCNDCLLLFLPGSTRVQQWLPGAERIVALSETYTPWCGHDQGLQTHDQLKNVVALGQALLKTYGKNAPFGSVLQYPAEDANVRIVCRTNRLF